MNRTLKSLLGAAVLVALGTSAATAQTGSLQGRRTIFNDGGTSQADYNRITLTTPATGTLLNDYTLTLPPNDGNADDILFTPDGSGTLQFTSGDALFWRLKGNTTTFVDGTNNLLGTLTNDPLNIITNNLTRIRITNAGNVGIGTGAAPSALFSVGTGTGQLTVTAAGNLTTAGNITINGTGTNTIGVAATTNNITGTNTILGATSINTSGVAQTTIGNTATGGLVFVRANNDITIDVGATTNDLVLNNIPSNIAIQDVVWLTAANEVRRTPFAGLVEQGLTFNNEGGNTRLRLGGTATTSNPFLTNRYVNLDVYALEFTAVGGIESMLQMNGATGDFLLRAFGPTGEGTIEGSRSLRARNTQAGWPTLRIQNLAPLAASSLEWQDHLGTGHMQMGIQNAGGANFLNSNTGRNLTIQTSGIVEATFSSTGLNIVNDLTVGDNATIGDADGDSHIIRGATQINTTAANAQTTIGALTNTGAIAVRANNNITIDVAATTNNLVLNNIATATATDDVLWITAGPGNGVRRASFSGLANEGLMFENGAFRLGHSTNGNNPITSARFVRVGAAGDLTFNTGSSTMLDFDGATGNVGISTGGAATTTIGSNGAGNISASTGGDLTMTVQGAGSDVIMNGITSLAPAATDEILWLQTSVGNEVRRTSFSTLVDEGLQYENSKFRLGSNAIDVNPIVSGRIVTVGTLGTLSFRTAAAANNMLQLNNNGNVGISTVGVGTTTIGSATAGAILLQSASTITGTAGTTMDLNMADLDVDASATIDLLAGSTLAATGATGATVTATTNNLALNATAGQVNATAGTTFNATGATGATVTATTNNLALNATAGQVNATAGTTFNATGTTGATVNATTNNVALNATAGQVNATAGTTFNATGATGATVTATTNNLALNATAGQVNATAGTTFNATGATGATITATANALTLNANGAAGSVAVNATGAGNDVTVTANDDVTVSAGDDASTIAADIFETATTTYNVSAPTANINTGTASTTNIGNATNGIVNIVGSGNNGVTITGTQALAGNNTIVMDVGNTNSNLILNNINNVSPIQDLLWITSGNEVRRASFTSTANEGLQFQTSAYRLGANAIDVNPIVSSRIVTVGTGGTLSFQSAGGTNNMLQLNNSGNVGISTVGAGTTTIGSATAGAILLQSASTITGTAGTTMDLNMADLDVDASATIDLAAGSTLAATGATGATITATANNLALNATAGQVNATAGSTFNATGATGATITATANALTLNANGAGPGTVIVNATGVGNDVTITANDDASTSAADIFETASTSYTVLAPTANINASGAGNTNIGASTNTVNIEGSTNNIGTVAGNNVVVGNATGTFGLTSTQLNVNSANGELSDAAGAVTVNDAQGLVVNSGAGADITITETGVTRAGAITIDQGAASVLTLGNTAGTTTIAGVSGTPNITATSLANNGAPAYNAANDGVVLADNTGLLRRRSFSDLVDANEGLVYNETGSDYDVRLGSLVQGTGAGSNALSGQRYVNLGTAGILTVNRSAGADAMLNINGSTDDITAEAATVTINGTTTASLVGATVNVGTNAGNNVVVGNATGTFGLTSTQLNVNSANGELSDAAGAVTVNDAEGFVVNTGVTADLNFTETTISRVGNIAINPGAGASITTDGSVLISQNITVQGTTTLGDGAGIDNVTIKSGGGNVTVEGNTFINNVGTSSTTIGNITTAGGVSIQSPASINVETGGSGTVNIQTSGNGDVVIGNTPSTNDLTINANVRGAGVGAGSNRFAEKLTLNGTGVANYTINNTRVTANSVIIVTLQNYNGAGILSYEVNNIVPGLSFDLTLSNNMLVGETVVVNYMIINQ